MDHAAAFALADSCSAYPYPHAAAQLFLLFLVSPAVVVIVEACRDLVSLVSAAFATFLGIVVNSLSKKASTLLVLVHCLAI